MPASTLVEKFMQPKTRNLLLLTAGALTVVKAAWDLIDSKPMDDTPSS